MNEALRVNLNVAVSLTDADRSWAAEHPVEVNRALSLWYAHDRACRRKARRRGDSLESGIALCTCR